MNTKPVYALILIAAVSAAPSRADTYRDYEFNGTVPPGTIDTQGAFGPAGTNIGGDRFTADVYFDENIGLSFPVGDGYIYGGGGIFNAPVPVPSVLAPARSL